MNLKHDAIQLGFKLQYTFNRKFENFISEKNKYLISYLQQLIEGSQNNKMLYLYGKMASGKSHLLQASAHYARERRQNVFYLPLKSLLTSIKIDILEHLDKYDVICIDDIDAICNETAWEEAYFHFYNRIQMAGKVLIFSAQVPATDLNIKLADLKSRLVSVIAFEIATISDEEKIAVLKQESEIKGFTLSNECAQFLLSRYSRDMANLIEVLSTLDEFSLSENRKITIPFIKKYLDKKF